LQPIGAGRAVVEVVMTAAAQEFITPLTFQSLTHRPVHTDMFDLCARQNIAHVSLAAPRMRW